jgi:hypothetical protein
VNRSTENAYYLLHTSGFQWDQYGVAKMDVKLRKSIRFLLKQALSKIFDTLLIRNIL